MPMGRRTTLPHPTITTFSSRHTPTSFVLASSTGYVCTSPTGGRRLGQANQAANVHPVRCLPALLWHKGTSVFERRVKTYVSGKRDCADDAIGLASTERLEGPWSGSGSWMAETFSTVVHYIHSENTTDLAHSREAGDR